MLSGAFPSRSQGFSSPSGNVWITCKLPNRRSAAAKRGASVPTRSESSFPDALILMRASSTSELLRPPKQWPSTLRAPDVMRSLTMDWISSPSRPTSLAALSISVIARTCARWSTKSIAPRTPGAFFSSASGDRICSLRESHKLGSDRADICGRAGLEVEGNSWGENLRMTAAVSAPRKSASEASALLLPGRYVRKLPVLKNSTTDRATPA
mmetsp:Transcript_47267/g.131982  ORF Transcript_47267/g.131982 Transcript_47267/m.131982 type:complete len:211 (-) Transcript_47267:766-1398(-)